MKKSLKSNRGFTLIELLVVIAIIGILSGIVLVAVGPASGKARAAKATSDLAQMMTALEMMYNDACPTGSVGSYGPAAVSAILPAVDYYSPGKPIDCTVPVTNYIKGMPAKPTNMAYTLTFGTAGQISTYTIKATGFKVTTASFECSGGSCLCYSAPGVASTNGTDCASSS
ncbi:MAG: type II secretion system protein [Patescibacteria group bacterium]